MSSTSAALRRSRDSSIVAGHSKRTCVNRPTTVHIEKYVRNTILITCLLPRVIFGKSVKPPSFTDLGDQTGREGEDSSSTTAYG